MFAYSLRAVVALATACIPLAVSFAVVGAWLAPAWRAAAESEYAEASASRTVASVLGTESLCAAEASRCRSLGLRVVLPSGETTVIRWGLGKTFSSQVTLWRQKEGVWTASAPVLAETNSRPVSAVSGAAAGLIGVVILVLVWSVSPRAWVDISPLWLSSGLPSAAQSGGSHAEDSFGAYASGSRAYRGDYPW